MPDGFLSIEKVFNQSTANLEGCAVALELPWHRSPKALVFSPWSNASYIQAWEGGTKNAGSEKKKSNEEPPIGEKTYDSPVAMSLLNLANACIWADRKLSIVKNSETSQI